MPTQRLAIQDLAPPTQLAPSVQPGSTFVTPGLPGVAPGTGADFRPLFGGLQQALARSLERDAAIRRTQVQDGLQEVLSNPEAASSIELAYAARIRGIRSDAPDAADQRARVLQEVFAQAVARMPPKKT